MWLIKLSSLFYALMGLILTYKILLFFTDSFHALLSTSLILLASNLFWFSLYQVGMSHVPLFFLYACLIYTTIKVHQTPRFAVLYCIGFLCWTYHCNLPYRYIVYDHSITVQYL